MTERRSNRAKRSVDYSSIEDDMHEEEEDDDFAEDNSQKIKRVKLSDIEEVKSTSITSTPITKAEKKKSRKRSAEFDFFDCTPSPKKHDFADDNSQKIKKVKLSDIEEVKSTSITSTPITKAEKKKSRKSAEFDFFDCTPSPKKSRKSRDEKLFEREIQLAMELSSRECSQKKSSLDDEGSQNQETVGSQKEDTVGSPHEETVDSQKEDTVGSPHEETVDSQNQETVDSQNLETVGSQNQETVGSQNQENDGQDADNYVEDYDFSDLNDSQKHKRRGDRKYPCPKCSKVFSRSDHVVRHLKVHAKWEKKARELKKQEKIEADDVDGDFQSEKVKSKGTTSKKDGRRKSSKVEQLSEDVTEDIEASKPKRKSYVKSTPKKSIKDKLDYGDMESPDNSNAKSKKSSKKSKAEKLIIDDKENIEIAESEMEPEDLMSPNGRSRRRAAAKAVIKMSNVSAIPDNVLIDDELEDESEVIEDHDEDPGGELKIDMDTVTNDIDEDDEDDDFSVPKSKKKKNEKKIEEKKIEEKKLEELVLSANRPQPRIGVTITPINKERSKTSSYPNPERLPPPIIPFPYTTKNTDGELNIRKPIWMHKGKSIKGGGVRSPGLSRNMKMKNLHGVIKSAS